MSRVFVCEECETPVNAEADSDCLVVFGQGTETEHQAALCSNCRETLGVWEK
jgi:hypothetical protein